MSHVVVVGDALLDRDVFGSVDRLCPDAPAPVIEELETVERPGGAALAALLASRQGADVTLVAPIGEDAAGHTLSMLLEAAGVEIVPWRDPLATIEKQRIVVRDRPLFRLDRGVGRRSLPPAPLAALSAIEKADGVLAADYGGGALDDGAIRSRLGRAGERGTSVVWDPHPRGHPPPPGVRLVTPNAAEVDHFDPARAPASAHGAAELDELIRSARRLLEAWRSDAVCVTRGSKGAALVPAAGLPLLVPIDAPEREPVDTCGAGDAFAAACTVAFAAGAVPSEAVQSAVAHSARYVADGGALGLASPRAGGRANEPHEPPVSAGVVATGGCFDLLHAGHVAMLERARALGDRLIVLLNSDRSVRTLKGPGRPVNTETDRAAVLRSLACVDEVVVFDDDTPVATLRRLRPRIFVKGGDYWSAALPEASVLAEWGGVVVTVPYLSGHSTSAIVEQIGASRVV
jgi:rfaE bifunctional protein nucleotidyltransferase chain/domain/rfaE bifunctional protein kinase chain/domain